VERQKETSPTAASSLQWLRFQGCLSQTEKREEVDSSILRGDSAVEMSTAMATPAERISLTATLASGTTLRTAPSLAN